MTADRAAKKPLQNAKFLGERQYASLYIPTLRAGQRTSGHTGPHIDEKIGTHDDQPFFRVVRAARHQARRTKDRAGSSQKAMAEGTTVGARNPHRTTITMSYSPSKHYSVNELAPERKTEGR